VTPNCSCMIDKLMEKEFGIQIWEFLHPFKD
jgi:hypothetical protein